MSYDPSQDWTGGFPADLCIVGKAPRCRKVDRHCLLLPDQSRYEISDELREAARAILSDFREVRFAKLAVIRRGQTHVETPFGSGSLITLLSPYLEESLI